MYQLIYLLSYYGIVHSGCHNAGSIQILRIAIQRSAKILLISKSRYGSNQINFDAKISSVRNITKKNYKLCYNMTTALMLFNIFCATAYALWPMFMTFVIRQRIYAIGKLVPYVDHESIIGYFATMLLQVLQIALGQLGNGYADLTIFIQLCNFKMMVELFIH